ncbi:MAG: IclR family transcriptional regulator [Geminicoccaceae bacterium]|nr:IclR family transcriptional regulator [Geminicoccaceae bacterium]
MKLASRAWTGNRFCAVAEPHLVALQRRTGETVHLGILSGAEVVYLDKIEAQGAIRMHSQIGNASPVYCTGVGKAALAALPDALTRAIVDAIDFRRFTDRTIADPDRLWAEVEDVRRTGNAFDREEHEAGIVCVAAPIHSADRRFVAGVSGTGPAFRVDGAALEGWAPLLRRTAAAIMDDMGTKLGPRG